MWVVFIGGFLFFWLIGSLFFKDFWAGVLVPIGLIILGFMGIFLTFVFMIISSIF